MKNGSNVIITMKSSLYTVFACIVNFFYYSYFYMLINKTFLFLLGFYFVLSEVDSMFKLLLFSQQIIETWPLLQCAVPGPVFSS